MRHPSEFRAGGRQLGSDAVLELLPGCRSTDRNEERCFPGLQKQEPRGHSRRLGNGDHNFSANVAGLDMAHSFCSFVQRVGAVDDGNYCAALD
jgi:hypothetical protein